MRPGNGASAWDTRGKLAATLGKPRPDLVAQDADSLDIVHVEPPGHDLVHPRIGIGAELRGDRAGACR